MSTPSTREPLEASEPGEVQISRALLSVSDKTGIIEFARGLIELGIEIVSTGGTATTLAEAGIPVRSVTDLTGFPEIMDGRVKTLNPRLYASLLAVRANPEHVAAANEHEVEPVDLVCVNLYPFERTASTRGVSDEEVIENIDIGGPTMIRGCAKNFAYAAPVTSPAAYDAVLEELRMSERRLSLETRRTLASEAFAYTARYDTAITRWFQEQENATFPAQIVRAFEKTLELPHGENSHQRAGYYTQVGTRTSLLSMVAQLSGTELSYNNLLDLDCARGLLEEFVVPACVIVTHAIPCGAAIGASVFEAYTAALAADPVSAEHAVIAVNRDVDRGLAEALRTHAIDAIYAPGYSEDALAVLLESDVRILHDQERRNPALHLEIATRQVRGGLLVQDRDLDLEDRADMSVVSVRRPTEAEWSALIFAWKVSRYVRSGAVVIASPSGEATVGIGAGQTSRLDAVRVALSKARSGVADCVLASDGFFADVAGISLALEAGISAILQPGGSLLDHEVVEAVDRAGAAMAFTGRRHFRH